MFQKQSGGGFIGVDPQQPAGRGAIRVDRVERAIEVAQQRLKTVQQPFARLGGGWCG
ncbi:hypothetical protein GCM10011505_22060 [Tistrella bauzanensis]|uniref:Uncharacterized protein n=1 Tax=Tistrella bauzanensis TaxID=657419 RepID=A0ABQ1IIU6_9PROT|nr:hypothetical protein GCM10011505_22060 [Tistrella bauzanensis]